MNARLEDSLDIRAFAKMDKNGNFDWTTVILAEEGDILPPEGYEHVLITMAP